MDILMDKERKKFKETKVGSWLKEKFPDVLDAVGDLTGIEAFNVASELIDGKDAIPSDKIEWYKMRQEYELEILRFDLENVKSAREREVGYVQATGKPDYAQWSVGLIGLVIACTTIYVGLFTEIIDREIYFHLLGIVEGAILLSIFNYYFGSSKGSADKSNSMKKLMK